MVRIIHEKCTAVVYDLVLSYWHTNKKISCLCSHKSGKKNHLPKCFEFAEKLKFCLLNSAKWHLCGTRISLGTIPSP